MMVLGSEDVGRVRMSEPTQKTWVSLSTYCAIFRTINFRIQFLRDVKEFFGTSFKIVPADASEEDDSHLMYSCYGIGYVNVNRSLA